MGAGEGGWASSEELLGHVGAAAFIDDVGDGQEDLEGDY